MKEEWETYYYESGAKRDELISKLSFQEMSVLNDHILKLTNPKQSSLLNSSMREWQCNLFGGSVFGSANIRQRVYCLWQYARYNYRNQ